MKNAKYLDCWEFIIHATISNTVEIIAHSVLKEIVMLVGIAIRRVPIEIFDCAEAPRESSPAAGKGADALWATVLSTPFPAVAAGSACSIFLG